MDRWPAIANFAVLIRFLVVGGDLICFECSIFRSVEFAGGFDRSGADRLSISFFLGLSLLDSV